MLQDRSSCNNTLYNLYQKNDGTYYTLTTAVEEKLKNLRIRNGMLEYQRINAREFFIKLLYLIFTVPAQRRSAGI
jgi:hypothetical protein